MCCHVKPAKQLLNATAASRRWGNVHGMRHYFYLLFPTWGLFVPSFDHCQGSACEGEVPSSGWWLQHWGRGALGPPSALWHHPGAGLSSGWARQAEKPECRIEFHFWDACARMGMETPKPVSSQWKQLGRLWQFFTVSWGKMVFRDIHCVLTFSILHGFTTFCKNELFKSIFPKVTWWISLFKYLKNSLETLSSKQNINWNISLSIKKKKKEINKGFGEIQITVLQVVLVGQQPWNQNAQKHVFYESLCKMGGKQRMGKIQVLGWLCLRAAEGCKNLSGASDRQTFTVL